MKWIRRRPWVSGLVLGLAPATPAWAQQALPDPLPPLPPTAPAAVVAGPPVVMDTPAEVRPTPSVVVVPPGGFLPTWGPEPLDPVAAEKSAPKHVARKARSWGWRRFQGRFLGYPEEFEPRTLGAALYDHGRVMVANGTAARLTLYRYDFQEGSAELTQRGLDQLAKLGPQLAAGPYPLLIERTPEDAGLAQSRRFAVLARLARGPCPVGSDRVLVGVPIPNGLSGPDAQITAGNALARTVQYGPPIPINSNGVNSPSGVTVNASPVGP